MEDAELVRLSQSLQRLGPALERLGKALPSNPECFLLHFDLIKKVVVLELRG